MIYIKVEDVVLIISEMASNSSFDNNNECQICMCEYSDPKLLKCGHLVCLNCLVNLLSTHHTSTLCPFCRRAIVQETSSGLSSGRNDQAAWRQWAEKLPTDFSMIAQIEAARVLSEDGRRCVCDSAEASSYCLTCSELYCDSCTKAHKKQRISSHHEVRDLATLTSDQLGRGAIMCNLHHKVFSDILFTRKYCSYVICSYL